MVQETFKALRWVSEGGRIMNGNTQASAAAQEVYRRLVDIRTGLLMDFPF